MRKVMYFIFLSSFLVLINCTNTDKTLKFESNIEMNVVNSERYKGVILLNDSIVISEVCPQIKLNRAESNNHTLIKSVSPPFYLKKEKNSDILLIVKNLDSIYFKLINLD